MLFSATIGELSVRPYTIDNMVLAEIVLNRAGSDIIITRYESKSSKEDRYFCPNCLNPQLLPQIDRDAYNHLLSFANDCCYRSNPKRV